MNSMNYVCIQGVPRSGTSWLGQIFKSAPSVAFRFQPLFSYAFKDRLGPDSSKVEIIAFFEDILQTDDRFVLQQDDAIHVDYPTFSDQGEVTHLVMKEVRYNHILKNLIRVIPDLKVIGLVRDPRAVMDSWINAPREFKPEWNVQEQWRSGDLKNQGRVEEFFGFNKWKEVAQLFIDLEKEDPEQCKVVRYADLNSDPLGTVRELFDFCDLTLTERTISFIEESRSKEGKDANSIYRKTRPDTAWQERLPVNIADAILEELEGTSLARFL